MTGVRKGCVDKRADTGTGGPHDHADRTAKAGSENGVPCAGTGR